MLLQMKAVTLFLCLHGSVACSGSTNAPRPPGAGTPASIGKVIGDRQAATVGAPLALDPTVEVRDANGGTLGGIRVSFTVTRGGGWITTTTATTDQAGRASIRWYLGPSETDSQQVMATAGTVSVRFDADATSPAPGQRTFGPDSFIEWIAGNLPVVVSAPHGGGLTPSAIPDRTAGTTTRDLNTEELAREIGDAFQQRIGRRPHLVISRLHRRKLDPNREIVEAAAGNPLAETSWREYHGFIRAAAAEARRLPAIGFYIDLHGHGHPIQRIELGYLLSAARLNLTDSLLNADPSATQNSARAFSVLTNRPTSQVIRGPSSLGAWLAREGYPAVPSPSDPSPGSEPYFEGGYSTEQHGTSADNLFGGVQVELNFTGIRDTPENRRQFADKLVVAIEGFLRDHHVLLRRGP